MSTQLLQNWLVPLSTVFTLISVAVGVWLSLRDYRLKLQAETRLKHSSQVELDIQLLKVFTELMPIAHARGGYHVSEKAVERVLQKDFLDQVGKDGGDIRDLLTSIAVVRLPVGVAQQDAAIAAIAILGKKHEILKEVSIRALKSISDFRGEIAQQYLSELEPQSTHG